MIYFRFLLTLLFTCLIAELRESADQPLFDFRTCQAPSSGQGLGAARVHEKCPSHVRLRRLTFNMMTPTTSHF